MSWSTRKQARIIRRLHSSGYRAYPLNLGYGRGFKGILGQARNGSCVFVLLKCPKQHLSVWQVKWLLRLRSDGFLVFTAKTESEVEQALSGKRP